MGMGLGRLSMLKMVCAFMSVLSAHVGLSSITGKGLEIYPPTCTRIECPDFETVHVGNGFEIRRFNSTVWISTSSIQDISLVDATRTGFLQLFEYIQGKNNYQEEIEMTAPVITEVRPSDGPFCESSFRVSFYVPREKQADPPPAKGLEVQRWKARYAAVRQFSGFVKDSELGEEAAALKASLEGGEWGDVGSEDDGVYTVAQYNSPFEYENRVNEIWMLFDFHPLTIL